MKAGRAGALALIFLFFLCQRENSADRDPLDMIDTPANLDLIFFTRRTTRRNFKGAQNFDIPVSGAVIGASYHQADPANADVLFFHGNGEVVPDYDDAAELFAGAGLNLFVVDYRGYGWSTGSPSLRTLLDDSHKIAEFFLKTMRENAGTGKKHKYFLMGRSLGSGPVCEIALNNKNDFSGLILESGFGDIVPLLRMLGMDLGNSEEALSEMFSNDRKLSKIDLPVLIIHGERDHLIPLQFARQNFEAIRHNNKKILVLPGAEHNNVMTFHRQYFKAMADFVKEN